VYEPALSQGDPAQVRDISPIVLVYEPALSQGDPAGAPYGLRRLGCTSLLSLRAIQLSCQRSNGSKKQQLIQWLLYVLNLTSEERIHFSELMVGHGQKPNLSALRDEVLNLHPHPTCCILARVTARVDGEL
jgi:hypothetical protein